MAEFKSSYDEVKSHNARKDVSYKLALNQFADWSVKEREDYL